MLQDGFSAYRGPGIRRRFKDREVRVKWRGNAKKGRRRRTVERRRRREGQKKRRFNLPT